LKQPEKVGTVTVRAGATVWELSQRTGVPVERILEFNAQMGQPIDPARLQVGQQILVPLGADEVTFRPRTAEEVQRMRDQAALDKALASMPSPTVLSPEAPFLFDVGQAPLGPAQKERALAAVRNDQAIIAEDEKHSRFSLASPSTWVDTKAEEARYAARDAFSQAVDRYEGLLRDPGTSPEALRAAETDKLRALNAYNKARGVTDQAAASANYLTPLAELAEKGQDALHDLNRGVRTAMADALTSAGVPSALVGAATLPSHVFDSVVDFDAGVAKGAVQLAHGLAGMVAHPVQTAQGVGGLIDRAAQATPQGRTLELLFEAAYGKHETPQELLAAYQERTDPLSVAKAQVALAADVGRGMVADSIRLTREGKYEEAVGTALGQNVDMLFGAAVLGKAAKLRAGVEAAEAARPIARGLEAEGRAAAEAAADTEKAAASAAGSAEGTRAAGVADTITRDSSVLAGPAAGQAWPAPAPAGPKPRISEAGAAEWRYQRYQHEQAAKGRTPAEILSQDEWIERYFNPTAAGGRPGRIGGPEQVAAKTVLRDEGIRIVENVQLGGRYPDGIRARPNALGGTDYFEVGRMLKNGLPEARERVKLVDELRALRPGDTVTFVDRGSPVRRVTYRVEDLINLLATLPRRH